jgi:choline kinase
MSFPLLYSNEYYNPQEERMIENAIILAAGTGTRLKPLTDHAPKCLTEINGTPILLNALQNLSAVGIKDCTIVGGYFSDKIKNTIGSTFDDISVNYLLNKHYASTNDMYSLWLARHVLSKGALLLEGDIFFRAATLKRAITQIGNKSSYIAGKYNGKADEILITVDPEHKVCSIEVLRGKSGVLHPLHYMSTGMLIIQGTYGAHLSQWLTEFVQGNNVNVLFDDILSAHTTETDLYVYEIQQDEWVEVDTLEDVREAERVFC